MKEVNFLKLTGKNFLSIGNVPIEFSFPSGINIITGYNFDKNDENGVGKTTIVQLFYWTLFGTPLSNLNKNELLNDINNKQCVGTLEFEVVKNGNKKKYIIERGIKPSYCKLIVDGEDDKNPSTIPILNKQIENIISSTPLIFKNCIVLSMNNSIPFMAQGKPDRKNFIESMFRLEVLRYMEKHSRKAYNELVRTQDLNIESFKLFEANQKSYEQKEQQFKNEKKEKIKKLQVRKKAYKDEIEILNSKLLEVDECGLTGLELELEKIESEYDDFLSKTSKINSNLLFNKREQSNLNSIKSSFSHDIAIKHSEAEKHLSKEDKAKRKLEGLPDQIQKLKTNNVELSVQIDSFNKTFKKLKDYGDICIKCERPFSDDDKGETEKTISSIEESIEQSKKSIETNKAKILKLEDSKAKCESFLKLILKIKEYGEVQVKLKDVEVQIEKLEKELKPFDENVEKFKEKKKKIETQVLEIKETIHKNNGIIAEIKNLNKFLESLDEDILDTKNEKNTFDTLIVENREKLEKYQKDINLTSEELEVLDVVKFVSSEDGLKAYIIKKLLDVLNNRIEYYLNLMESNAKLSFDEYFDDSLYSDKGIEKSYDNFSGGEQKRIDLACLFSFLDIRRIQGDVRFNVIFFDELLDSAISSKACDLVFSILSERFNLYNESSNIITHRKEFKSESKKLINNTIFLEKRNGFTKIGEIDELKI
jgi:DNA repair exonuclease SbcCD ATPase subunit